MTNLQGSEKQVAWATEIRERAAQELAEYRDQQVNGAMRGDDESIALVDAAIESIMAEASAKVWIDRRSYTAGNLITTAILQARRTRR
jgi:hypothetical protein